MPSANGRRERDELARLQASVRELQDRLRRREAIERRLSSARRTAAAMRRPPAR